MGIDIYARWSGMTESEDIEQRKSFLSSTQGHIGYLREAYHGEPYATRFLCREAFSNQDASALIPAQALRARLPETLRLAEKRERLVYRSNEQDIADVLASYRKFVELCEEKERETGTPVLILASY